jgi:hypothetical protein
LSDIIRLLGGLLFVTSGQTLAFQRPDHSLSPELCSTVITDTFQLRYSVVTRKGIPIKSGYRLSLSYSLRYTGGATGSVSAAIEESAKLRSLLASWLTLYKEDQDPAVFVYKLQHPTKANLCYEELKGKDQKVVKHLEEACSDTSFHLYLAKLERIVEGSCEEDEEDYYDRYDHRPYGYRSDRDEDEHHEIIEVSETTITLDTVFDLHGIVVGKDIVIEEDEVIQEDLLLKDPDREPDEEDYEEGTVGHHYRDTVNTVLSRYFLQLLNVFRLPSYYQREVEYHSSLIQHGILGTATREIRI